MLSCWIIETARSAALNDRGHTEAGVRAAERARILARGCQREGVKIQPAMAQRHCVWMAGVAGAAAETGALGWMFLQRTGMYVEAHIRNYLPAAEHERMVELSEPDIEKVNEAIARGLPDVPGPPGVGPASDLRATELGAGDHLVGIVADPHISPGDNDTFCQAVDLLNSAGAELMVIPGDLTRNGEPESYESARYLIAGSKAPVAATMGNHDVAPGGPGETAGRAQFESVTGGKAFGIYETEGVRAIMLNSAVPEISPFPPFDILGGDFTDTPPEAVPWGSFDTEVVEWMSGLGPAGVPTFIFLHHPPFPYLGFPPLVFGLTRESTLSLEKLVDATGAAALFCGHTHRSALSDLRGVPVIEVPSNRHWPFGFGALRIQTSASTWSFNVHPNRLPPEAEPNDYAGYIFRRYAAGDQMGMSVSGSL